MIQMTAGLSIGTVKLKDVHAIIKYFDEQHSEFANAAVKVHRKTVFEVLIYLLRLCPVLTGRLRGSWTPFLDKYGKQSSYAKFLNDRSLAGGRPKSMVGRAGAAIQDALGMGAVDQGKREGFFTDGPLITNVGTNVVYAEAVNQKSHYMDRTLAQAQMLVNRNFENFIKAAREKGWIPTDFKDDPETGGI